MQGLFVGVDGGGTKVRAVCVRADGTVLYVATSSSTNQNSVGWDAARSAFEHVIAEVLSGAGSSSSSVSGACLGMSGVDRPAERDRWMEIAQETLGKQCLVTVANDALIALASGTMGNVRGSIVCLSGTGTICLGVPLDGKTPHVRCQGWGPLLGDRGGGYDIGLAVLRAVMRAHDGTGPATALTSRVLEHCGAAKVPDLVAWAYTTGDTREWQRYAALAPLAEEEGKNEDAVAKDIVRQAADALLDAVRGVHARMQGQLSEGTWTCVLAGGTLEHENSVYGALVKESITRHFGEGVRVVFPTVSAGHAAALMAIKSATTFL